MRDCNVLYTGFNGTLEEAKRYYLGHNYVYSDETETTFTSVEQI
jgi:hypothetical protein